MLVTTSLRRSAAEVELSSRARRLSSAMRRESFSGSSVRRGSCVAGAGLAEQEIDDCEEGDELEDDESATVIRFSFALRVSLGVGVNGVRMQSE